MGWYGYVEHVCCFFAGAFLANFVPHFVHGISGDRFPTPFSKPPGRGLSSPVVNVTWGLLNLVLGFCFFRVGKVWGGDNVTLLSFFAGIAALSVMSAIGFEKKQTG